MPSNYSKCNGCIYCNTLTSPLSATGSSSGVMLVFQAPGCNEIKTGTPISSTAVHSAGYILDKCMNNVCKSRVDFVITEVVQCYPGKSSGRDKKPLKTAIKNCRQFLINDIRTQGITKIVSFGTVANNEIDGILTSSQFKNFGISHTKLKHPCGGETYKNIEAAIK